VLAGRVAEGSRLDLVLVAGQRSASSAAVGVLGARDADIGHASGAVRGADAAANVVEAFMALGVPEGAPLLAVATLVNLTGTTTVGIRLVAVGTVITEATVVRAVLPADGTDTGEAILTVGVAEGAILLLVIRAGGERLASSAAIGLLPAGVGHISVVVVVMEVVNGGAIVVLLGVSERLLGVVGEVRHVLLILVVRVVSLVSERIVVHSMETTVMVGAVIEVFGVVVGVVMSVLHLVMGIVVIGVVVHSDVLRLVMMVVQREVVMDIVMGLVLHKVVRVLVVVGIHALNVVIVVMKLVAHLVLMLDVVSVAINLNRLKDRDAVVWVL
jgi:hypothetical protein